ncbi:MAG: ABC transporter permease [Clostridium sp.]|nr:ABC transporter permease [Clostridium sp.]
MNENHFFVTYFKRNMGTLIGLFLLCAFLSITTDSFLDSGNLLTVLRQVCINATLAFGMTYVLIIGSIDLSVGSVLALSGVTCVMLIENGFPFGLALPASILLGSFVGLVNGIVIAFTGIPPFIVTLAMQTIVRGFSYIVTNGTSIVSKNEMFNSIGNKYVGFLPIPVIIVAVIIVIAALVLNKTKFGRRMYAVGGNKSAAVYSGINSRRVEICVHVICATLAAVGGIILASRMYSAQPTAGQSYEGDAIAAAVLGGTSFNGGVGTIGGTIIGALIIGFLNNGMNLLQLSYYWQLVVKGIVIIGAVYLDMEKKKGRGIFALTKKKA